MSNVSDNSQSISTTIDISPEHVANLLLGGDGAVYDGDDEESVLAFEQEFLSDIETLRAFAVANELDIQKIIAAIAPYYTNKIPADLEHSFSRLESTALERDTYVSVYIDEEEASLVLWCCKNEDGSQVAFDDLYLPYESIREFGEDYRPKYSAEVVYGQSVDPMKAVKLYNSHKAEIIELNIKNSLRDVEALFGYLVKYIKDGLTSQEIIEALDSLGSESADNEVESSESYAPTLTP